MDNVEVRFEDIDGDGEREVVVENRWLKTILRFPETRGVEFYKRRWTWGGRLQSLVYKPTGREYFLPEMVDLEDITPFGLPDELFAFFPLDDRRRLKMGVGVFVEEEGETVVEPLPWTWYEEQVGSETVVAFRQQAEVGEYSFVYEKRYRFRAAAAWFALDVVWENRGQRVIASDWDIHSFHAAGEPPHSAWLVAPKRAWVSYGKTRLRTVLKEAAAVHVAPVLEERVWERLEWDLEGEPWWYAAGPGDGAEFYLFNARFEPDWGLHFSGYGSFTPQGISHIEVPPGDRAIWGFDVTLGMGGKHFVRTAADCGMTLERVGGQVVVAVHVAEQRQGELAVHVLDAVGAVCGQIVEVGSAVPEVPLQVEVVLPGKGEYVVVEAVYRVGGRVVLQTRENVALGMQRPTAILPFDGGGARVFVASHHALEHAETDGRYLAVNGREAGFVMDWVEPPAVRAPARLGDYAAVCLVGDAWPLARVDELRDWVLAGGALLVAGPFGAVAEALGDVLPLRATGPMQVADPPLGLELGTPHYSAERLMLEPDAKVRVAYWVPTVAVADAVVTLRFSDQARHPAIALRACGAGRVAALASRPAWGAHYNNAAWDGWGQYYRACFAGLLGWLSGVWVE